MPQRIEALEAELDELQTRQSDPELYRTQGELVAELQQQTARVETELEQAYERWETLEALKGGV